MRVGAAFTQISWQNHPPGFTAGQSQPLEAVGPEYFHVLAFSSSTSEALNRNRGAQRLT